MLEGQAEGDKDFAQEVVTGMHGKSMDSLPEKKGPGRYPAK